MMRKTRAAFAVVIVGLAAMAWAAFTSRVESQQGARPVYTADGKMLQLPAGFETWVFVGSNLGLAYKDEMTLNDAREANRAQDAAASSTMSTSIRRLMRISPRPRNFPIRPSS